MKTHLIPFLTIATLTGCASTTLTGPGGEDMTGRELMTLTNLHHDAGAKDFLYSINYQRAEVLPVCTPVTLSDVGKREFKVTVKDTGEEHLFIQHKATPESMSEIAAKYFGPTCDRTAISKLSRRDREGIERGEALTGMTKQGVIFAVGYPPSHRTPSLESDRWIYWTNRFATDVVEFKNDRVIDGTR